MDEQGPLRDAWSHHNIRRRILLLAGTGALASIALLGGTAWLGFSALDRRATSERQRTAAASAHALDRLIIDALAEVTRAAGDPRLAQCGPTTAPDVLHDLQLQAPTLSGALLQDATEDRGAGADGRPKVATTARPWLLALTVPLPPPCAPRAIVGLVDLRRGAWMDVLARAAPPGGSAEVVDGAGRILVTTNSDPVPDAAPPEELRAVAALTTTPLHMVLREPAAPGALRTWRRRLLAAAPALLALAVLFAWGAGRSLTAPLAVLTAEAERIAAGDLDRRVPDLGPDQAGRLGRAFEAMRRELARALDALVDSRRDLEARVAERTAELETLYRALRQRDESRGRLLQRVISAQEEERRRIARDLHDDTCQALAVLGMRLDALRGSAAGPLDEALAEARALAQRTTDGVHRLIFDLRPSVLDDLGLLPAVRWFATRHLEPRGVAVLCEFDDLEARLPADTETALFRAVQEAITNVARHADARTVVLHARRVEGGLEMEIEDDGAGFEPGEVAEASPSGRGLGLLGIRERLQLLGGDAHIESAPGLGTRVLLRVPVEEVTRG